MGPKALQVTGELADGTLPYLAGPRTIGEFIVPTITKAAADAGRPEPRIVAAEQLSFYETIPSYRNVIAREGAASVVDLAAIGPEESVARQLRRYRDAGATDVVISPLDRSSLAPRTISTRRRVAAQHEQAAARQRVHLAPRISRSRVARR